MEFLMLLVVTLLVSIVVAGAVVFFFRKPIDRIFNRIIGDEVSSAWAKFLKFALFVVGISSGVRIWSLERYIEPTTEGVAPRALTTQAWGLEIYQTIMGSLGGLAWALLVFFVIALVAYAIGRWGEMRNKSNKAE